MNRLLLFLTFLCLSFFSSTLSAQEENFDLVSQVIPPSPNAATLAKFGDIPVSLYTGTPNISIPLYNLQGRNLSVPISLKYHASGVKVEEVAGHVGLSWALTAGGSITRTVRGRPDESNNGYIGIWNTLDIDSWQQLIDDHDRMDQVQRGLIDVQPDFFYINVPGYSGKMVFDMAGHYKLIPHANVQIIKDDNLLEWTIITPDGISYVLGQNGATESTGFYDSSCGGDPPTYGISTRTSWLLTSIIHPNGEIIRLEYDNYGPYTYDAGISESQYRGTPAYSQTANEQVCATSVPNNGQIRRCINMQTVIGKHLQRIVCEYGRAEFNYSNDRLDLPGDVRLENIQIFGATGQTLRRFELGYDYFTSVGGASTTLNKRLKLKSVIESNGNDQNPPYKLDYLDETNNANYVLPPRLSTSQDHWGYYNNNSENDLLPDDFLDPKRDGDAQKVKAGMLYKIHYPTGGFTEFEFESNDYSAVGEPDSAAVIYNRYSDHARAEALLPDTCAIGNDSCNQYIYDSVHFTIDHVIMDGDLYNASIQWVQYNTLMMTPCGPANSEYCPTEHGMELSLRRVDENGNTLESYPAGAATIQPLTQDLLLVKGHYIVEAQASMPGDFGYLQVTWNEIETLDPENETGDFAQVGGGVRIKSMASHPIIGPTQQKSFEYRLREQSNRSSGVLISEPVYKDFVYFFFEVIEGNGGHVEGGVCEYSLFQSRSFSHLGMTQGAPLGYLEVVVKETGNGSVWQSYSFVPDEDRFGIMFGPSTSNDWQRGFLLHQETLDESGAVKQSVVNQYDFRDNASLINNANIEGLVAQRNITGLFSNEDIPAFDYKLFKEKSYWLFLASTTTTLDGVSSTTDYTYSSEHLNTLSSEMRNSDGKIYRTETDYPFDAGITILTNKYIHNIPVETRSFVDGNLIGGKKMTFQNYLGLDADNQSVSMPLPFELYQILHDGTELKRATVLTYDDHGNLNSFTQEPAATYLPTILTWEDDLVIQKDMGSWRWKWDYYDNTRQLKYAWDINNIQSTYEYDDLQRLEKATGRNGEIIHTYGYNYALADNPNTPNLITSSNSADNLTIHQYLDGLGRSMQSVSLQYSPHHRDVVNAQTYDDFGRPERQYYPFEAGTFGAYTEPNGPADVMLYEASPLHREKGRAFADGSSINQTYSSNGTDEVIFYDQYGVNQGFYEAGTLYKTDVTDENGNITTSYTDRIGRNIAVVKYLEDQKVATYNVYDDRGNLKKVYPPGGTEYSYTYDNRNRLTHKSIPEAGTQTFGYDDRDLMTSSTDANNNNLTYQYDIYGRLEWTKLGGNEIVVNTYDTAPGASKGLLATSSVAVLNEGTTINNVFTYDDLSRVISTTGNNHINGSEINTTTYDGGTDRVTGNVRQHGGYESMTIAQSFDFDHSKRLINTWHQIGNNPFDQVKISHLKYDYRDQLVEKNLHRVKNEVYLQSIDYRYNVRGWLTHINEVNTPPANALPFVNCDELEEQSLKCGEEEVSLEQFLAIRLNGNEYNVNCYEACTESPGGGGIFSAAPTGTQLSQQANSLNSLAASMATTDAQALLYPVEMNHIQLYQGEQRLVLADELSMIKGEYVVDQCQQFDGPNDTGKILVDGNTTEKPFSDILEIRKTQTPWLVEPDCEVAPIPVCKNYKTDYTPQEVRSTTLFSQYNGQAPYNDLTAYGQSENGSVIDAQLWTIPSYTQGEAAWYLGQNVYPNLGTTINSFYVTIEVPTANTGGELGYTLALHNGEKFIEINGGQNTVAGTSGTITLLPDEVPSAHEVERMRLVIYLFGGISIDGVEVHLDYDIPCDCQATQPSCSEAETVLQQQLLQNLYEQMATVNANTIAFPTNLNRVTLCDGTVLYLLDQELVFLSGTSYGIDQEIPLTTWSQTLLIGSGGNERFDLFALRLFYQESTTNTGVNLAGTPQHNGNIANMFWQSRGSEMQYYGFAYDDLDRLQRAQHHHGLNPLNHYTVDGINYDLRGNILSLQRQGLVVGCEEQNNPQYSTIDDLVYTYADGTNRLRSVEDIPNDRGFKNGHIATDDIGLNGLVNDDYQYDNNGNMIVDLNKGITVDYNFLNLPEKIIFTNTGDVIEFTYDATGTKLRKQLYNQNNPDKVVIKDYLGGIEYLTENNETVLEALYHGEGRVVPNYNAGQTTIDSFQYEYTITDHLGNARMSFSDLNDDGELTIGGEDSEILQESHYYPFGMKMEGNWVPQVGVSNVYQYNGKELNEEFGLGWSDYGARWYDPAIARWNAVDPSAEKFSAWSGYNYTIGNPIVIIDPDGRDTFKINSRQELTTTSGGKDALLLAVSTGHNLIDLLSNPQKFSEGTYEVGENGTLFQYREFSLAGVKDLAAIAVGEAGSGPDEARGIASAVLNQFGFNRQNDDVTLANVDKVAKFATIYAKYPPTSQYTAEQIANRPYATIQNLPNGIFFDVNSAKNWGRDRIKGALQAIQLGDHPNAVGATHWEGNAHLNKNSWHNRQLRSGNLIHTSKVPLSSVIGQSTFYKATSKGRHLVLK